MNHRMKCYAATLLACLCFSAHAAPDLTVPPTRSVAGKPQAEWSKLWWQWAGSFERSESPVADKTGELCGAKQSGPVWFLAGTFGTQRTVRQCKVPKGKHLFFPLINYVVTRPFGHNIRCKSALHDVASLTDDPSMLVLDINGTRIEQLASFRQATKCFNLAGRSTAKQVGFFAAANGYYVMLKPLAPGTHVINFGGALPSMLQAVTYTIVVE